MAPKPEPLGESDYKKMGMGEANLWLVYATAFTMFMTPGVIGASVALFGKKADGPCTKVQTIAAAGLGPLYLGFYLLKFAGGLINANLGMARRPTGVNVPDQHIYKVTKGSAEGSIVLMDDKDELYGPFNRAQRALQNFYEGMAFFIVDCLMAGYVFPSTTAVVMTVVGGLKVKAAVDYTKDRELRLKFGMPANILQATLGGLALVTGLRSTYLQLKK
mmetsp:Transcript_25949/g.59984  ORF Transcript_25949/g.59984 Transcript_25949/m.59984 type:complete len:218 (-) Transcript_25949:78-731(-)